MNRSANPDLTEAMVDVSAMVFAAKPAEDALQTLADALDVQTVAIVREDGGDAGKTILAQNAAATLVGSRWNGSDNGQATRSVVLQEGQEHRDTMIVQTRMNALSPDQRSAIDTHQRYLAVLWASRSVAFERALETGRTPARQSVLHPDNPYGLTQTEFRVCGLIAAGHRPAAMAHILKTSMATVRTHLRGIYAKTGLDGMVGVLNNLQVYADDQKIAG